MENSKSNNIKERIGKVTSLFLLLLILISLGVSLYYNETLQQQINERDILLEKLTRRDSILNKIMDFRYDSIEQTSTYSYRVRDGKVLKYNTLAEEFDKSRNDYNAISEKHNEIIDENNQNINDYNSLAANFDSLNKEHNDLMKKYSLLASKYNAMIEKQTELNNYFNQVTDSLSSFKSVVHLIQLNYPVNFNIDRNGNIKKVRIKAEQLDSALILLPYFRDRLKLDKDKKVWTIKTGQ
jgi:predicted nuclease with TOPRIM domain